MVNPCSAATVNHLILITNRHDGYSANIAVSAPCCSHSAQRSLLAFHWGYRSIFTNQQRDRQISQQKLGTGHLWAVNHQGWQHCQHRFISTIHVSHQWKWIHWIQNQIFNTIINMSPISQLNIITVYHELILWPMHIQHTNVPKPQMDTRTHTAERSFDSRGASCYKLSGLGWAVSLLKLKACKKE